MFTIVYQFSVLCWLILTILLICQDWLAEILGWPINLKYTQLILLQYSHLKESKWQKLSEWSIRVGTEVCLEAALFITVLPQGSAVCRPVCRKILPVVHENYFEEWSFRLWEMCNSIVPVSCWSYFPDHLVQPQSTSTSKQLSDKVQLQHLNGYLRTQLNVNNSCWT